MNNSLCLNCNASDINNGQFCAFCGQKKEIHRFTTGHLVHEFLHAFTHADKSIFQLIKQLAVNPGKVLREYIIEGKRKRYFNPFTFLLIILGISVFANSVFHPFTTELKPDPAIVAAIKSKMPEKLDTYLSYINKQNNINEFYEQKTNWVTLLSTPIISFVFLLFFRKKQINYAEHFVAYVFLIGFIILITTFTIIPLMSATKGTPWYFVLVLLNLICQLFYFAFAYKGFLRLSGFKQTARASLAGLTGILVWVILTFGATLLYFWIG